MPTKRLPFNEPGRFTTIDQCEGCGQCLRFAPANMAFDPSKNFCYVLRQPTTSAEIASFQRAMKLCPMCAMKDTNDRLQEVME
jgi:ferredoxin